MIVTANNAGKGSDTSLPGFYAGASVLVTGGTGYLGKVLIEKLLWACPDVTAIYVLTRKKNGEAGQKRINTMLRSECFDRLRQSRGPGFGSKVIAVQGDVTEICLGLNDLDRDLLACHVSIVFHVAATIRFNEPLQKAVVQNVRGTRELLTICRTCPKIKAVVHVSTAYAHCPQQVIEERFYDAPIDSDLAIKMAAADEFTLSGTKKLLGPWPNTYSFTKALAEDVVVKHGKGLPVCVFRPAMVVPSFREPVEGWVDNVAGPVGFLGGYLAGYIRVFPSESNLTFAFVPCDMVVNGMIAAAWDVAQSGKTGRETNEVPIYNFTPAPSNPITCANFLALNQRYAKEVPSNKAIWTPSVVLTISQFNWIVLHLVLHTLPAAIADVAVMLTGNRPFLSHLYNKIHRAIDECRYFFTRQFNFEHKNVTVLWNKIGQRDRAMFNFDMASLDWDLYVKASSHGLRKFILKEDPSTIPAAKARHRRISQVKLTLKAVLCFILFNAVVSVIVFVFKKFPTLTTRTSWDF